MERRGRKKEGDRNRGLGMTLESVLLYLSGLNPDGVRSEPG